MPEQSEIYTFSQPRKHFANKKKLLPLQKLSLGPEAIFENKNWLLESKMFRGLRK